MTVISSYMVIAIKHKGVFRMRKTKKKNKESGKKVLRRDFRKEPLLPVCFHSEKAVAREVEDGIYMYVAAADEGYYGQVSVYVENLQFDEGITPDDVAYIQSYYWDGGGWCFPDENYAVYVAIGKEHFERLRELGGLDFMYHPKSELGSEEAKRARHQAEYESWLANVDEHEFDDLFEESNGSSGGDKGV